MHFRSNQHKYDKMAYCLFCLMKPFNIYDACLDYRLHIYNARTYDRTHQSVNGVTLCIPMISYAQLLWLWWELNRFFKTEVSHLLHRPKSLLSVHLKNSRNASIMSGIGTDTLRKAFVPNYVIAITNEFCPSENLTKRVMNIYFAKTLIYHMRTKNDTLYISLKKIIKPERRHPKECMCRLPNLATWKCYYWTDTETDRRRTKWSLCAATQK